MMIFIEKGKKWKVDQGSTDINLCGFNPVTLDIVRIHSYINYYDRLDDSKVHYGFWTHYASVTLLCVMIIKFYEAHKDSLVTGLAWAATFPSIYYWNLKKFAFLSDAAKKY